MEFSKILKKSRFQKRLFYAKVRRCTTTVELDNKELFGCPKIVPYPYEVNGKLVTRNGSLIPICSLSNRSLLPSLTIQCKKLKTGFHFVPLKQLREIPTLRQQMGGWFKKVQKCADVIW